MPRHKGFPPPDEYIELVLCRDIYHCSRRELYRNDWQEAMQDYEMHVTELKAAAEARRNG